VPLPQDRPGPAQLALMQRVKEVERLTVSAVVEGRRDDALRAFARHPLIDSEELAVHLLAGYEAAFPALRLLWRVSDQPPD
jgi:6-phospho-beta-glucosidase